MDEIDPHIIAGVRRLCGVMAELIEQHEGLLTSLKAKREAFAHADHDAMAACVSCEGAIVMKIEELDRARRQAALSLAARLQIKPRECDVTVSMLLERLPERAGREQLRNQSAALRGLVAKVREQTSLIKEVGESLLSHVRGIAQKIRQAMNQTGVYGRDGRVADPAYALRTVDVRS